MHLQSLLTFFLLSFSPVAWAGSSCIAFDITWNLLAFGFNGKDYNAGTQDTWTSGGTPTDITTSGRPPFNGANATCFLSEFTNAIYVMGADTANPTSIYIYDATAKSWSTQSVTAGTFDPTNSAAILDHDTNVFYAYANGGELFSLDMQLLKSANSTPIPWVDVQKLSFNTAGYQPVMALAQNHIHFFGVPGTAAGSAIIFVIHFSFLQPDAQSYGNFPDTHGQATSFFLDSGVQENIAFIPDDGSATFVVNVETNTTQTLTGPTTKDPLATYFASTTALVQLSSKGVASFLPFDPNGTNANAQWNVISILPTATPSASTSASGGSTAGSSGSSSTATTGSAQGAAATGNTSGNSSNSAIQTRGFGWVLALVFFSISALFV